MSAIRFYHLTRRTADQALPELVSRALARGHKILIRSRTAEETRRLNEHLWNFDPDSFIPHGAAGDGAAARQPVFLTEGNDNPAKADVLMLMPGAAAGGVDSFALSCILLNGRDEVQVAEARALWTQWKEAGHELTYWQQGEDGKWGQQS